MEQIENKINELKQKHLSATEKELMVLIELLAIELKKEKDRSEMMLKLTDILSQRIDVNEKRQDLMSLSLDTIQSLF